MPTPSTTIPSATLRSSQAQPRPLPWRRWSRWLLVWAIFTTLGSLFHWAGWIVPHEDPTRTVFLGEGIWRPIGNLFAVAAAPGWIVVVKIVERLLGYNLSVTIIANGAAWAFWFALLAALLRARRYLARGPLPLPGAAPASDTDTRNTPTQPSPQSASPSPINRSRRALLVNSAFAGGALTSTGAFAVGTALTPWQIVVARHRVPIKNLPPALVGLRLVQISDTHLGPRIPASHIQRAVALAIDLKPDVILLTGDYIHNGVAQIDRSAALMAPLCTLGIPVLGTLGNHDWYADGKKMAAALTAIGVRMIDDDRVYLDAATRTITAVLPADPTSALCIAGLSDLWTAVPNPKAALDGVPLQMPRLLLSHHPDCAELPALSLAAGRRVDLMLSGHTHGGQVAIPLIGRPIVPSLYRQRYAHGLVQGPAFPVIISAGVGMSLIPIRLGVPPEVVLVELVAN